jgi:non-homologous end joining protein Ku
MKIIKARMKGGKAPRLTEHEEPRQAEVIDLMERLRQSLQGSGGGRRRAGTGKTAGKSAKARKTSTRGKTKRRAA